MKEGPLAVPLSQWRQPAAELDSVVIGSGYGGAVAALRLAQSGSPVVVFERGSEYLPGQFPNDATVALKHLCGRLAGRERTLGSASGIFEWHVGRGVVSLTGNGLGGGSLINAGVVIEPSPEVFEQRRWPEAVRSAAPITLADAFERARRTLRPERYSAGLRPLKGARLAAVAGAASEPEITVDLATCTRCGDCATGCNWGAKRTLRETCLASAREAGAQLVSNATARSIRPLEGGRWEVLLWPTERTPALLSRDPALGSAFERRVVTRRLVVAAGTFGSTELLQRSQARCQRFRLSRQLGQHFSANGDSLSFLVDRAEVNAFGAGARPPLPGAAPDFGVGPTITTMLDRRRDADGHPLPLADQVLIQDGAVPAALARFTEEMLSTAWLVKQLDGPRFVLPPAPAVDPLAAGIWGARTHVLLAMGHDGSPGRIKWNRKTDSSRVIWKSDAADNPAYRRQQTLFQGLERGGLVHLHPLTWQALPKSASGAMSGAPPKPTVVTVHPLGGCIMGSGWDDSVVDHWGRPWKEGGGCWDNLWVLDGSIIPTALGANPLLTITALAERALQAITAEAPPAAAVAPSTRPPAVRARPLPAAAPIDASLSERLVAARLQGLEQRFEHAELTLEMGSSDWLEMWRSGPHRVAARGGTLRLHATGERVAAYRVGGGWFELLPYHGTMAFAAPAPPLGLARLGEWSGWLRALFTWAECRGIDDVLRATRDWLCGGARRPLGPLVRSLFIGLAHAVERREMRYRLTLELAEPGPWTDLPGTLTLLGRKRVGYGAELPRLLRWPFDAIVAGLAGEGTTPPKRTFWDQVLNPDICILSGAVSERREALARFNPQLADAWLCGRFEVDIASLLAQAPLHLNTGDLTNGVLALGAYPMLFGRHAVKTQLLDFRRPDYAPEAPDDPTLRPMPLLGREPECHVLHVPRDDDTPNERLALKLTHYRAPRRLGLQRASWGGQRVCKAPSVLLLHAFAQSGAMFTLPEPHPSLARHLLEAGFDVWVLDHRISIRLPYTDTPSHMVQIARHDIPCAVDVILRKLADENKVPTHELQIFALGQCIGGASLAISLLDGRLSHGVTLADDREGPAPRLSKLAGAVISQTHPFLVGMPQTRAKTWVPAFVRDTLRRGFVPFAARGEPKTEAEGWLDRLFASMPVPDEERCPGELNMLHRQDDCATCRRIRFIEAPLFRHANLLHETHRALPFLFGDANVHLFAHAARCVESERLVDDEGGYVFVTDEKMRQHFTLPIAFLHGEANELFHVNSARRSAKEHARLFPGLASIVAQGLGQRGADWIVPGFGHVDVILAREAPKLVFEPMAGLFASLLRASSDEAPRPALRIDVNLRPPLVGPLLGALRREGDRLKLRVAFLIDDRFSDASDGPQGRQGTRTWALVRCERGERRPPTFQALAIHAGATRPKHGGSAGYRIAHGELLLETPPAGTPVKLLAFSLHQTLAAAADGVAGPTSDFAADPAAFLQAPAFEGWIGSLIERCDADVRHGRAAANRGDPARRSPSVQSRTARPAGLGRAVLAPASIAAGDASAAEVEFFASCCRYPGWPFDRERVDASARRLLELAEAPGSRLAFGLLLGDQIYADATAGIVDPLAPVERYFERYRSAFGRAPDGSERRSLGDLLAALPAYLTPDDHEFRDGFPDGLAVDDAAMAGSPAGLRSLAVACDALDSFQFKHMPPPHPPQSRNYAFEHGPLRCFVLDTRTERQLAGADRSLLRPQTLQALADWLAQPEAAGALNCIASGSVLLPRLKPDPTGVLDDSTGWSPADRAALLRLVGARLPGRRILLLAGDYHLSVAAALQDRAGRVFGAAVVTPPLYAPLSYANAVEDELDLEEDLAPFGINVHMPAGGVQPGSGFATLRVQRRGTGYRLEVARWLQRHELNEAALSASPAVRIDID